jgi:hypothetical protein
LCVVTYFFIVTSLLRGISLLTCVTWHTFSLWHHYSEVFHYWLVCRDVLFHCDITTSRYFTTDLCDVTYFFIVTSLLRGISLLTCVTWRTFSLWHHWYAFSARVLIMICIFCTVCWLWYAFFACVLIMHFFAQCADVGKCDIAHIMPSKFCIITNKYMINRNTCISLN